ncbi:MAG TPA: PIN domain-containing protein [Chthoniobacteraceae bacterium]|nr:PIN domain-containing protein [Chthoniobacteraceae bacterium]
MGGRALVDSTFIIGLLRQGLDPLEELTAYTDDLELLTCGIVQVEVLRGLRSEKASQRMSDFPGCMLYVPTLNSSWTRAATLAHQLDRQGHSMQVTDLVIATCAIDSDALVLTHDPDFARVPGLRVAQALT